MVLEEGFPLVIHSVAEHGVREDVTLLAAGAAEDVLRSQEVQRGVGVQRLTAVPLSEGKARLDGEGGWGGRR